MKNLKRALTLVLACAMIFGMFAINASAASFTDDTTIVNGEAVAAMTQLNIIKGYEDGSFKPTQVVTRAEMAKMLCVALNGGVDPVLGADSLAIFADTQGHWANAYISYCYKLGIVSGDSGKGGNFRPEATVTGTEAAKMMLVAMGYNPTFAGFTGADWAINVGVAANEKRLFNNLASLNVAAGLSRDNAAQIIYNGINAVMVKYTNVLATDPVTGALTSTPSMDNDGTKTIMSSKYNAIKVEGVVKDNEFLSGDAMKAKTEITVTNAAGVAAFGGAGTTFKVATTAADVGKSVTLYVRESATAPGDGMQATIIGTPVVNTGNKIYTTSKKLENAPAKSNDVTKTLTAAGLKFKNGNNVKTYTNYAVTTAADATAVTNIANYVNNLGVDAQYIDNNNDGLIDVVTYLAYSFGQVTTATTAGDGTLNVTKYGSAGANIANTKANTEVVNFADLGLANKDYVKYYLVVATSKYYVEKMTGTTVAIISTTGAKAATADKTYEASSLALATDISAEAGTQATLDVAVAIGKSAVFYLDNAGAVIYVTEVATAKKYLMLIDSSTDYGPFLDTLTAKVVLDDATTATAVISKIDGVKVTAANIAGGGGFGATFDTYEVTDTATARIYSYSVDSDGKYSLTTETTVRSAATTVTKNVPTIAGTIIANNTSKMIVNSTGASYTLYNGISEVATRTTPDVFAVTGTGNIAKVVFTYGGTGFVDSNNYFYVLSKTPTVTKDSNDADVYTYNVVRGGAVTTIVGTAANLIPGAGLYKATLTGTKMSGQTATDAARIVERSKATGASNGVVGNATGSYLYDANTKFFTIKAGVATEAAAESIVTAVGSEDYISMVLGTGSAANTAQYVFIERDSFFTIDVDGAGNTTYTSGVIAAGATWTVALATGTGRTTFSAGDIVALTVSKAGVVNGADDDMTIAGVDVYDTYANAASAGATGKTADGAPQAMTGAATVTVYFKMPAANTTLTITFVD